MSAKLKAAILDVVFQLKLILDAINEDYYLLCALNYTSPSVMLQSSQNESCF